MSHTNTSKVDHELKGAAADTKKEVHKEQAKDSNEKAGTRVKAAAKVPGEKVEAEGHKNHPATSTSHHPTTTTHEHKNHPSTSKHSTTGDHHDHHHHSAKTNMQTTTKDGTTISVQGAGPEIPSLTHPPSNKKIDSVLTGAHHELEAEKRHLDSHGQEIASSTQNVLDATSLLLNEKNKEERFQRLFLFTQGATKGGPSEGIQKATRNLMTQATGMGSKISNDATDVISYIRETIFNLTTSGEFRQMAIEFLNLLQSLMGQLKTAIATTDSDQPLKANKLKSQVFENEEDRLEDINEKLAVFLKRVGKNPQYRTVVNNFMKYSEEIYDALYKAKKETSATKEAGLLRNTLDEGWEILNDFVGDNKLVPKFKKNLQAMLEKVRKDQELTLWMKEFKSLLTELMDHPENAAKDQKRTSKMIKSGGDLTDKYRRDLDKLYSEARRIVDTIQSDPVVLNFQQQLEKLGRDIALNNKGQPDLFVLQKSMNVIRDLLVERFRKVLIDVPIERVHIKSDTMEVTLKNISIQGHGLAPNNLRVELMSISDFNFERSSDAAQKFRIRLRVEEIRPHFKGVRFNFKKTSFPSIKDKGVADIIFEGTGLFVDVAIQFVIATNAISKARFENCTVNVDRVNLKIEEAKHDLLGAMFAPIIQSRLKAKIQAGVYEFVNGRVRQLIDQLNRWFQTKPFETMMVKGNETIQTTMEKREEQKVIKEKRKLSEGKKELTAEQKLKKKAKKLQRQKDGTYVKLTPEQKQKKREKKLQQQKDGTYVKLTAEQKQKKREKKLQQQKDGTYVKGAKTHKDGKNLAGVGYQSGAPGAYQQQPMMGQQYPMGQQPMMGQQQPMLGQQYPVGQQQNFGGAYQQGQMPMMNQQQGYGQQHVPSSTGMNDYGHHQQQPHVSGHDQQYQQQHSGVGHQQPHSGLGHQQQPHSGVGGHDQQHQQNPNVIKSGLQTQEHFVHPPADYQPNQHQQHYPNDASLGHQHQQEPPVGSTDRINKLMDPNYVSQVKDHPSS